MLVAASPSACRWGPGWRERRSCPAVDRSLCPEGKSKPGGGRLAPAEGRGEGKSEGGRAGRDGEHALGDSDLDRKRMR